MVRGKRKIKRVAHPNDSRLSDAKSVLILKEGIKHDSGKAPLWLNPLSALEEEARVWEFGAKKYDLHNWRKGMDWTRALSALIRHAHAIAEGQDYDPETGLLHAAHIRCCAAMLIEWKKANKGVDDRGWGDK